MAGRGSMLSAVALTTLCVGCQGSTPAPAPQDTALRLDDREEAKRAHKDGLEFLAQGRVVQAVSRLQRALVHDPLRHEVHLELGLCYYLLGEYSLEIAEYQKCLAINPSTPRAWKNLGHAYLAADALSEAKGAYEHYLALVPHDGPVLYNLGLVALDLGLDDEARDLFQRSKRVGVRGAGDRLRELERQ